MKRLTSIVAMPGGAGMAWRLISGSASTRLRFAMDEGAGRPSRWNTLRAMRVLRW